MYKDFDAMFARMKGETIPFRIYGKEYHISPDLPAALVLELARCEGDVPPKLVFSAAGRIFGKDVMDEIAAHDDFTLSKLEEMLSWAFEVCSGGGTGGGGGTGKN